MMETPFVKTLRLITPERAQSLGLGAAEAPVFVSAYVADATRCEQCGVRYSPLVYHTGQVTVAQHLHEDRGGIYFSYCAAPRLTLLREQSRHAGFAAVIEPVTAVHDYFPDDMGIVRWGLTAAARAAAVRVSAIVAYCIYANLPHPTGDQPLAEGELVPMMHRPTLAGQLHFGALVPLCDRMDVHPVATASPFRFHIEQGVMSYSRNTRWRPYRGS